MCGALRMAKFSKSLPRRDKISFAMPKEKLVPKCAIEKVPRTCQNDTGDFHRIKVFLSPIGKIVS
jgi:hypothetical protein